jgi:hypothetical protein
MNLIKKNMVLAIVLCATLVIALGLLYLVSRRYGGMKTSLAEVQTLRDEINDLNDVVKKPIAPLKENVESIHTDFLFIRESTRDLQQVFGKPYHQSLEAFATALEFASVAQLKEKWAAFFRRESTGRIRPQQAFLKFLGEYDREKVDRAVAEFKREAETHSVELLNEANLNDVILEALGHPRTMSPEACKTYITYMQASLAQMLQPQPPKEGEHVVVLGSGVEKFTFADFDNRMPLRSDVSYIIKNWKLIEDLAFRLKKSQVSHLAAISRRESLKGREADAYLYLPYEIEIEGPQEAVQALLNSLQDAWQENRTYIVRDLEFSKSADEVAGAVSPTPARPEASAPDRRPGRTPGIPGAPGSASDIDAAAQAAIEARADFGRVLIGRNRNVKAKIVFDYVIFIGDEIKGD